MFSSPRGGWVASVCGEQSFDFYDAATHAVGCQNLSKTKYIRRVRPLRGFNYRLQREAVGTALRARHCGRPRASATLTRTWGVIGTASVARARAFPLRAPLLATRLGGFRLIAVRRRGDGNYESRGRPGINSCGGDRISQVRIRRECDEQRAQSFGNDGRVTDGFGPSRSSRRKQHHAASRRSGRRCRIRRALPRRKT